MTDAPFVQVFGDDALGEHDGVALAERIARGELSAAEVVRAAIARARRADARLAAIAVDRFEQGQAEARRPGQGAFAGVPVFVKDNAALQGLPTGHGSAAVRPGPAKATDPYVEQLLGQGFVCIGKTALSEFGLSPTNEPEGSPPTRNPWNTAHTAGASSSGSAALVAAGAVPIAHANDGGGSIRIPAACCGLVGLKPSRGRHVVSEMARALPLNLISQGVVTRTVRDTAHYHAEAERLYRDRRLPAIGLIEGPNRRRLRIGYAIDSITGKPTDGPTRAALEEAVGVLEALGHELVPAPLPVTPRFADDFLLYWQAIAFSIVAGGRRLFDPSFDRARVDGLTRGLSKRFARRFYRLPLALHRLHRSRARYVEAFADYDAFLTPVLATVPPPVGYLSPAHDYDTLMDRLLGFVAFTPLANATGAPAIALPWSRSPEGVPIGVQVSATIGDERTLLELAYEIEAAHPWPTLARIGPR